MPLPPCRADDGRTPMPPGDAPARRRQRRCRRDRSGDGRATGGAPIRRQAEPRRLWRGGRRRGPMAALTADAPFVERLVHFWANHFAVSADKLQVIGLVGLLEFEAIRPHVLGTFGDMLIAVERHPAMLLYLDQAQSIGPNSSRSAQRAGARRQPQGRAQRESRARDHGAAHARRAHRLHARPTSPNSRAR